MKDFKEFVQSYSQTTKNMDFSAVYPYTEWDLQPHYSDIWKDFFYQYREVDKFEFLNPSVCRSMMVMDLYDAFFLQDVKFRNDILEWYDEQLNWLYTTDRFSLVKNVPLKYSDIPWDDYTYFVQPELNSDIARFSTQCFQYCYKEFGDIYADNGYEVIGPYHTKQHTIITSVFQLMGGLKYFVIQIFQGKPSGTIDLFGHSTIGGNCDYVLLDGDGVVLEIPKLTFKWKSASDIERNINSRLLRYSSYYNMSTMQEKILQRLERVQLQRSPVSISKFLDFLEKE